MFHILFLSSAFTIFYCSMLSLCLFEINHNLLQRWSAPSFHFGCLWESCSPPCPSWAPSRKSRHSWSQCWCWSAPHGLLLHAEVGTNWPVSTTLLLKINQSCSSLTSCMGTMIYGMQASHLPAWSSKWVEEVWEHTSYLARYLVVLLRKLVLG